MDEDTGGSSLTPDSLKSFLDYNDKQNASKSASAEKKEDKKEEIVEVAGNDKEATKTNPVDWNK